MEWGNLPIGDSGLWLILPPGDGVEHMETEKDKETVTEKTATTTTKKNLTSCRYVLLKLPSFTQNVVIIHLTKVYPQGSFQL